MDAIIAALEALTDGELQALIDATYKAPQKAPGLLAWIDASCEWELNHRAGHDIALRPPEAAIPPEEDAVSIDAVMALRAAFAKDSPGSVRTFLGALADLLMGTSNRH